MDVAALLLRVDRELDVATDAACGLLGYPSRTALQQAWPAVRAWLDGALDATHGDGVTEAVLDGTESARRLWLQVVPIERAGALNGHLVLLSEPRPDAALDTHLRHATHWRTLSRLYPSLAHDLKAPLHVMVINLELLKDSLDNPAPGDSQRAAPQRYVRVLIDEVSRLNQSLQTLLVHTARPDDARECIDFVDVVRTAAALLGPQAKLQRVAMATTLPPVTVPVVGARSLLKHAILNIALNALDAMPRGGQLRLDLERGVDTAGLTIQDSGPGIPPAVLSTLGTSPVGSRDTDGGVGLYVARAVVVSHGGTVRIASSVGVGTTVSIQLPLATEET